MDAPHAPEHDADDANEPQPGSGGTSPASPAGMHDDRRVNTLVITDVQVRPVSNNERLRAWVTITFNDAFVIKGIRIIKGHSRLFVAMPSRQQKDGSFQDVAHPINPEFRRYLEESIIGVYRKFTSAQPVAD